MLNDALKIILAVVLIIALYQAFDMADKQMKFDRCLRLYTAFNRTLGDTEKFANSNCGTILRKAIND